MTLRQAMKRSCVNYYKMTDNFYCRKMGGKRRKIGRANADIIGTNPDVGEEKWVDRHHPFNSLE